MKRPVKKSKKSTTVSSKKTFLELRGDVLIRWQAVGTAIHLRTSTQIALFLLEHYEKTQESALKERHCSKCCSALMFSCPTCCAQSQHTAAPSPLQLSQQKQSHAANPLSSQNLSSQREMRVSHDCLTSSNTEALQVQGIVASSQELTSHSPLSRSHEKLILPDKLTLSSLPLPPPPPYQEALISSDSAQPTQLSIRPTLSPDTFEKSAKTADFDIPPASSSPVLLSVEEQQSTPTITCNNRVSSGVEYVPVQHAYPSSSPLQVPSMTSCLATPASRKSTEDGTSALRVTSALETLNNGRASSVGVFHTGLASSHMRPQLHTGLKSCHATSCLELTSLHLASHVIIPASPLVSSQERPTSPHFTSYAGLPSSQEKQQAELTSHSMTSQSELTSHVTVQAGIRSHNVTSHSGLTIPLVTSKAGLTSSQATHVGLTSTHLTSGLVSSSSMTAHTALTSQGTCLGLALPHVTSNTELTLSSVTSHKGLIPPHMTSCAEPSSLHEAPQMGLPSSQRTPSIELASPHVTSQIRQASPHVKSHVGFEKVTGTSPGPASPQGTSEMGLTSSLGSSVELTPPHRPSGDVIPSNRALCELDEGLVSPPESCEVLCLSPPSTAPCVKLTTHISESCVGLSSSVASSAGFNSALPADSLRPPVLQPSVSPTSISLPSTLSHSSRKSQSTTQRRRKALKYHVCRSEQVETELEEFGETKKLQCMTVKRLVEQEDINETTRCKAQDQRLSWEGDMLYTAKKQLICTECGATFRRPSLLESHMRQHSGEKPFSCSLCSAVFSHSTGLRLHLKRHLGDRQYKCEHCNAAFFQSSELTVHLRTHTGQKPFGCEICGKHFAQSSHLRNHCRTHVGEKPFLCQQCGTTFTRSSTLKQHMRKHSGEKPFVCVQCGKAFFRAEYLAVHLRSHSGEKAFLCQQCGSCFSSMSVLAQHMHTAHTMTVSRHVCKVCGEKFNQLSDLLTHNQMAHGDEWPHQCRTCGAAFRNAASLAVHNRSHTGEKPYQCKLCPATFARSGHVTAHMRVHSGEKPYRCTECNQSFRNSSGLKAHKRRHAGIKPFTCETCGQSYTQKHNLMIHIMKKHPVS